MIEFPFGQAVIISTLVMDANKVPTNATVSFKLQDPDGVVTTPTHSNPGTGQYTYTFTPSKHGRWNYYWVSTGTVASADEGQFYVRPTPFSTA